MPEQLIVTNNPDGSVTIAPAVNAQAVAEAQATPGQTVIDAPVGTVTEPVTVEPGQPIPGSSVIAPRPDESPTTGPDAGPDAGSVDTSALGPSTEAVLPGQVEAPAPTGTPTVVTAEPETVGVDVKAPEAPAPPEPPSQRLAVGTHVVHERDSADGGVERRYGMVLEASIIPGATEPAYRIGWFNTAGGLVAGGELLTTREATERLSEPPF